MYQNKKIVTFTIINVIGNFTIFSDQILKKVIYDPFTIIIGIFQKKDLSSGHNRDLIVIWGKKDPILPISELHII